MPGSAGHTKWRTRPGRTTLRFTAQIADTHRLVQQLQGALGEYGGAFWDRLRPAQLARAVVATPYPLCAVSVGIHISAPRAVLRGTWVKSHFSRCACRAVRSHHEKPQQCTFMCSGSL